MLALFCGPGSTLIADEQIEREVFLVELDAAYCDAIVKRWEQYTGREAERSGSR